MAVAKILLAHVLLYHGSMAATLSVGKSSMIRREINAAGEMNQAAPAQSVGGYLRNISVPLLGISDHKLSAQVEAYFRANSVSLPGFAEDKVSARAEAYFRAKLLGQLEPWQQEGLQAFTDFVAEARSHVEKWPLSVADPSTTDQVAVTVFQPSNALDMYAVLIRWNLHVLGPKWALQVFYGTEEDRSALDEALGSPANVVWTPITLIGVRKNSITLFEYNWLRLSTDFWGPIQQEHVLIFESDSMVLQGPGCVEKFLQYDYVGSPWCAGIGPNIGGNGGFTLRRRGTAMTAVTSPDFQERIGKRPDLNYVAEDLKMLEELQSNYMAAWIAPRDVAKNFSVETIDSESPCGFHKPWLMLGKDGTQHLLDLARHSMSSV